MHGDIHNKIGSDLEGLGLEAIRLALSTLTWVVSGLSHINCEAMQISLSFSQALCDQ